MITQLTGTLIEKDLTRAVIDVNGVGYEVFIPMSTYDHLPREGEPITLRTKLVVREDLMNLYGFFTPAERQLFEMVTGQVSGIGPKLGLNVLSAMSVESFCANIVNADAKALSKINGVGKRTAERLVVELKDKVHLIAPDIAITGKVPDEPEKRIELGKAAEDAVSGLVTLGIKPDSARKTIHTLIQDLPDGETSAEKLIRMALTKLNT